MLKNKIVVRKIRNIVILLMAIIVMIGAYTNIGRSRAENVVELKALAKDYYSYLANEEFTLEAQQVKNELYEIEMPENVNDKIINRIVKVTLKEFEDITTENDIEGNITETTEAKTPVEDVENQMTTEEPATETQEQPEGNKQQEESVVENTAVIEEIELEIIDNKVEVTQEQLDNYQINIEVEYEMALIQKDEENAITRIPYSQKTEEEKSTIEITEEMQKLYSKILRYEDEENNKLVEVKGFLPAEAQLQVEAVTEEQLKVVFGEAKIDVAYDIKIVIQNITQAPIDEANPDAEAEEIIETIEIKLEDFGETCEVTIKDTNIKKESQVYHVKEDNTYEQVKAKDSTEENIKFDTQHFSIYAVSSDSSLITEDSNSATEPEFNVGTDEGITLGAADTETPKILLNGTQASGGTQISTVRKPTTSDYGKGISNYTANNGWYGWQLFHYDGTHIYLITDDYIHHDWVPTLSYSGSAKADLDGDNGYRMRMTSAAVAGRYEGIAQLRTFLQWDYNRGWGVGYEAMVDTWFSDLSFSESCKALAAMCYMVDGFDAYKNSMAYWAAGGPPLNLFIQSYNKKNGTSYSTVTSNQAGSDWFYTVNGSTTINGLSTSAPYKPISTKTSQYYLIGASGSNTGLFTYKNTGAISATCMNTSGQGAGFRPVVCLNAGYNIKDARDGYVEITTEAVGSGTSADNGTYTSSAENLKWQKKHTVDVTITDNVGLAASATIQYGWSTSTSTAPSTWTTLNFGNAAGATSVTKTITQDGGLSTGAYYLWIKGTNVKDTTGNANQTTIKTKQFCFDTTAPQLSAGDSNTSGLIRHYTGYNNINTGYSASATTWKDHTGNYNATLSGGTWFDIGLTLDGTDDWVNMGNISMNKEVTFSVSVTPASIQSGDKTILANYESGGAGLYLKNGSPVFEVLIAEYGVYYTASNSNVVLIAGQRYDLVGTYDGQVIRLYVDGTLVAEQAVTGTIKAPNNNTVLALGANPSGSTVSAGCTNINVYEVKVYDRALSQEEIKSQNDGLLRNYQATNNTGTGWISSLAKWQDLTRHYHSQLTGGTWSSEYLTLDGTDDWVNLGKIHLGNQITIETTIAINAIEAQYDGIISNMQSGSSTNVAINIYNGEPYFTVADGTSEYSSGRGPKLTVGQKYNLLGIYDGTNIKLYIDGELAASSSKTLASIHSGSTFGIGTFPKNGSPTGNYFKGKVYSARIWNRAITDEEIEEIKSGLIRHFDASQNRGINKTSIYAETWKDLSRHNNGLISGAVWNSEYLSLDGVDDWVHIGQVPSFSQITLEATIEPKSITGERYILSNCQGRWCGNYNGRWTEFRECRFI